MGRDDIPPQKKSVEDRSYTSVDQVVEIVQRAERTDPTMSFHPISSSAISDPTISDPTISDDRTRGSAFETNGDRWAALTTATQHASTAMSPLAHSEPTATLAPRDTPSGPPRPPQPAMNDGSRSSPRREHYIEQFLTRNIGKPRSVGGGQLESLEHSGPAAQQKTVATHQKNLQEQEWQLRAEQLKAPVQQRAHLNNQPITGSRTLPNKGSPLQQPDSSGSMRDFASIAKLFGIPKEFSFDLRAIQTYILELQEHKNQALPLETLDLKPLFIHRVRSENTGEYQMFLDEPQWLEGADRLSGALKGSLPLSSVRSYLLRHPELCFLICRDYTPPSSIDIENHNNDESFRFEYHSEFIVPVEKHLAFAIRKFKSFSEREIETNAVWEMDEYFQAFSDGWMHDEDGLMMSSPYLAVYHNRGDQLSQFCDSLTGQELARFRRVLEYVLEANQDEYKAVDDLTAGGKISSAQIAYLFKPGEVVIEGEGKDARGFLCTSYLKDAPDESRKRKKSYRVHAWHWDFGPGLARTDTTLTLNDISERAEMEVNHLSFRPLKYVDVHTVQRLQRRGSWFWKCRKRCMVAYRADSNDKFQHAANERYIIDMEAYHEIHPAIRISVSVIGHGHDNTALKDEALAQDKPPNEEFVYLVPSSTKGFLLKSKKWCDIEIDRFEEVDWNTKAFQRLVLAEKTKRLIHALISNQIEAKMGTDIISDKGNGLIMLLHGGPGTGKTLTAESVAEIARKPLYPVTCGDMGTEPREVEKYLESVLHLGKTWDCVVLLDEADVFLEQRSLEDLKRNALVSVFLRVLEYYDGILILTSNRVGTFDEAFKSRIQLAVHYTSLTTHQRTKVWGNFFSRLKELGEEGVDFPDLEDHIEQLARHKMNGREIRNVITTARQYARWERKQQGGTRGNLLDYKMMEEIIETSGKFDKYIAKLNGGMSQDELAEDEGLRLANSD